MSPKTEEKILKKLDRIEKILIQIVPQKRELTEKEALEIIEEGDKELREGKAAILHSLRDLR